MNSNQSDIKRKSINSYCCVPQCKSHGSKTPNVSFHKFPKKLPYRKEEWRRILRIGKEVSNRMTVCSKHFDKDAYTYPPEKCQRPRLKASALPTLFLPVTPRPEEKMTLKKKHTAKRLAHNSECSRRADRNPSDDSRLCSCHFKDGKKVNKPTIFSYSEKKRFDFPSPEKKVRKDTDSEMIVCCVPLCNSHAGQNSSDKDGNRITFHELPFDPKRRELWLKAIKSQEGIPVKFWEPIKEAGKFVICNLHFRLDDFVAGVEFRCLLPEAVPSVFPSYKSQKKSTTKRKKTETEKEDVPVSNVPCEDSLAAENSSSNNEHNLMEASSNVISEDTGSFKKDTLSPKKKNFSFSKLHKSLSAVQKPSQYWGVTPTDEFIIFSKWNDKYIPEKRVVIEHNLNVKVFLGELEINIMNLMEFTCPDDVSNLLDKVDSISYCGKSLAISNIN